jgi:hypothetical protein
LKDAKAEKFLKKNNLMNKEGRIMAKWWEAEQSSKSDNSSAFKQRNLSSGSVSVKNADGTTSNRNGRKIGSFRDVLQAKKDSAGAIGGFIENFAISNKKEFMAMQRARYGSLNMKGSLLTDREDSSRFPLNETDGSSFNNIAANSSLGGDSLTSILFGGSGLGTSDNLLTELSAATGIGINDIIPSLSGEGIISGTEGPGNALNQALVGLRRISESNDEEFQSLKGIAEDTKSAMSSLFGGGFTINKLLKNSSTYGKKFLAWLLTSSDSISGGFNNTDFTNVRNRIMCMPPALLNIIDPNGRAYNNNIMATQHVVDIIPGNLDVDGFKFFTDFGISNAAIVSELEAFESGNEGSLVFDATSALANIIQISWDKNKRIGNFKPQLFQFLKIYSTIMGRLMARLSPGNTFIMPLDKDTLETSGWGSISLALNNNTTLMESGSNTFSGTPLEGLLGGVQANVRNIKNTISTILGKNFKSNADGSQLTAILEGEQINLPKMWENSEFSRSYTLNFRLESPYGDTESLLAYVYKPFAALLALSLPIYRSMYSYTSPFVIRADCPGWFSIDCGYVSSIDFRRGPDDSSWNSMGLASNIEVTMSITDIYPALALSVGPSGLSKNFALQSFIDNITGMDYKEIYTGGSVSSAIRARIIQARMLPGMIKSSALAEVSRRTWKFPGEIFGFGNNR